PASTPPRSPSTGTSPATSPGPPTTGPPDEAPAGHREAQLLPVSTSFPLYRAAQPAQPHPRLLSEEAGVYSPSRRVALRDGQRLRHRGARQAGRSGRRVVAGVPCGSPCLAPYDWAAATPRPRREVSCSGWPYGAAALTASAA